MGLKKLAICCLIPLIVVGCSIKGKKPAYVTSRKADTISKTLCQRGYVKENIYFDHGECNLDQRAIEAINTVGNAIILYKKNFLDNFPRYYGVETSFLGYAHNSEAENKSEAKVLALERAEIVKNTLEEVISQKYKRQIEDFLVSKKSIEACIEDEPKESNRKVTIKIKELWK